jgi:hypothetical protein
VTDHDDELLAELGGALRAAGEVPADFVAAGRAAYTWLTIDAELAELAYDSAVHHPAAASAPAHPALDVAGEPAHPDLDMAGTRDESARVRALTFTAAALTIELEVAAEELLGQLVPAGPGEVQVHHGGADTIEVPVDELGFFAVRPVPAGWFRLRCRAAGGAPVQTAWTHL